MALPIIYCQLLCFAIRKKSANLPKQPPLLSSLALENFGFLPSPSHGPVLPSFSCKDINVKQNSENANLTRKNEDVSPFLNSNN